MQLQWRLIGEKCDKKCVKKMCEKKSVKKVITLPDFFVNVAPKSKEQKLKGFLASPCFSDIQSHIIEKSYTELVEPTNFGLNVPLCSPAMLSGLCWVMAETQLS